MSIPVNVILLDGGIMPKYGSEKAAGADLYAAEDVLIRPGETKLVRTGVRLELASPAPEEGILAEVQIRNRSGIALTTKLRVANSPGTIDEDYTGELRVIIDNIAQEAVYYDSVINSINVRRRSRVRLLDGSEQQVSSEEGDEYPIGTYLIRKGDRIAQAVFSVAAQMTFTQVEAFDATTVRGENGFGHTGTR